MLHLRRGRRVEADDGAPPVLRVLAPADEARVLELADELAGRREREAQIACHLADRPFALGRNVGEDADVPPAEAWCAGDEAEQFHRGTPPRPDAAHHPAKRVAKLDEIFGGNILHLIKVVIR